MTGTLLTYDVHKKYVNHEDLKKSLLAKGWKDTIIGQNDVGNDLVMHLPNTTFWKAFISAPDARAEFLALVPVGASIRLMTYEFDNYAGIVGYKHGNDPV